MAEILRNMQVFERVVSLESFTKAAHDLNITRSMVSQYIKQLEEELATQLLVRTTRSLALTPSGEEFYHSCLKVVAEAESALLKIKESDPEPSGKIRLTIPVDLSISRLPKILNDFLETYPRVELDISLSDQISNLVSDRFDIGIRVGWLKDSSMRFAKLAPMRPIICASTDYLEKNGTPKDFEDLKKHRWISLSVLESPNRWKLKHKKTLSQHILKFEPTISTDSPIGLYGCMRAGMGLAICPDYQAKAELENGSVKQLMKNHLIKEGGIFAVFPYSGTPPLRIKKLIEHLKQNAL